MPKPKRLILDTNPLREAGWPYLQPLFETLISRCRELDVKVYIPEVVLIELESWVAETYRELQAKADQAINGLNRFSTRYGIAGRAEIADATDFETGLSAYRDVALQLLERCEFTILPLPDLKLADLVRQAASRRPPFNAKGEGFRDALIVHSMPPGPSETGIFLTKDAGFSAEACRDELSAKGISIAREIDALIQQLEQQLGDVRRQAIETDAKRAIEALSGALAQIKSAVRSAQFEPSALLLPIGFTEVHAITAIEPYGAFENVRVSRGDDDEVMITAVEKVGVVYMATTIPMPSGPIPVADNPEEINRLVIREVLGRDSSLSLPEPSARTTQIYVQIEARARDSGDKFTDVQIVAAKPTGLLYALERLSQFAESPKLVVR